LDLDYEFLDNIPSLPDTKHHDYKELANSSDKEQVQAMNSEDEEGEILQKPTRMTMNNKMDAPMSNTSPRPLVTREQMGVQRDQLNHLESWFVDRGTGFDMMVHMNIGHEVTQFKLFRDEFDKRLITLEWDTGMFDENSFLQTFCSGTYFAIGDQVIQLRLTPDDSWVRGFVDVIKKCNGSERNTVLPKTRMTFRFDRPVKAGVSPIPVTFCDVTSSLHLLLLLKT
jgi:hypothetical protein